MTPSSFKRALSQLLVVPVVTLAILTGILALEIRSLQSSAAWVDHTDQVIARMNELMRLMVDEETGIRGYLLTQREEFLQPYNLAEAEIDSRLQELQQLVKYDPAQVDRIRKISIDSAAWETFAANRLRTENTKEEIVADSISAKDRMDRIRSEADDFIKAEEALRVQRSSRALSVSRRTFIIMALLAVLAAALITISTRRLFRMLASQYQSKMDKIQAQQEWLDTTLRGIGDAVIACAADGGIVFMNGVAEKLTGWSESEARGHALPEVFNILHEQTRAIVENPVAKVLRLGTAVGLANHTVLVRPDGSEIAIDDSGAPIRDAHGTIIGVVLVFRDVSERRAIENAMHRSEAESRARAAELEAIMQVVPAVTFIAHDSKCEQMTSSLFAQKLLHQTPGANISQTLAIDEPPKTFRIMTNGKELKPDEFPVHMAAMTGREIRDFELTIAFDNGVSRDMFGNAAPLFADNGEVRGAVGAFIDITDRKRTEEALRKSEKLAVVGRLAASISHEINNPLEAVTNLLYLVQVSPSLEKVREYAAMAQEELTRVSTIATQTLRFNRQSTRRGLVEVPKILDSVLSLYSRRLSSAGIKLERQYECATPLHACDGELRQVFINLVANAFDATRTEGKKIIIRTRESVDWNSGTKGIRVTVADTGHGMDRDTLKRIFEPFFSTRGDVGTGLGLWITKKIIEKHNGCVRVRSSQRPQNHGTVVTTFFPFSVAELDEQSQSASSTG